MEKTCIVVVTHDERSQTMPTMYGNWLEANCAKERLVNLAVNNLRSTPRRAAVSAAGVMIASSILLMVVGHGFAIRALVTEKVIRELPVNMLEVTPRTLDLGMFKLDAHKLFGGSQIDTGKVELLKTIDGVKKFILKWR